MERDDILRFVHRRWDLVEQEKLRARAERYRRGGPEACLAAAAELRARFLRLHPGGGSAASRAADLAHHVELSSKLRRIDDVLARR